MILNNNKTYVIAEAGVNHNGQLKLAKKMIATAKKCGADAIKFQNFTAENLVTINAKKAPYQVRNTKKKDTQYAMLKKLELKKKYYFDLIKFCKKKKIDFLSSVFDDESVDFLTKNLRINTVKIPSGEINNPLILQKLNFNKHKVLLSTGMSNEIEIASAINLIAKKKIFSEKKPIKILDKKFLKKIYNKIIILHCVTDYPVQNKFANLNCVTTLKNTFKLKVGYSDHTLGILAPLIAISKGSEVIEKHFTLNKNMKGPDHLASLDPAEFKNMVNQIRTLETMRGDGAKKIQKCEIKNKRVVRKSIVAKKNIKKGEILNVNNITTKRPAEGLSASNFFKVINTIAKKNYKIDDLI